MDNNFIKQDFKLTTKNKRLKETLDQHEVEDGAWIDDYNQLVNNDGVAGTIQNGIDFRNHQFVAEKVGGGRRAFEKDSQLERLSEPVRERLRRR